MLYFVIDGNCVATKTLDGVLKEVKSYGPGDYFGERALIKNEPRAANIVCHSDVTVVYLEIDCFKRLLGSVEDIMKRNMASYALLSQ